MQIKIFSKIYDWITDRKNNFHQPKKANLSHSKSKLNKIETANYQELNEVNKFPNLQNLINSKPEKENSKKEKDRNAEILTEKLICEAVKKIEGGLN